MSVMSQLRRYANKDIATIANLAGSKLSKRGGDLVHFNINPFIDFREVNDDTLDVIANISSDGGYESKIYLTYTVDEDDDVYVDISAKEYADSIADNYTEAVGIKDPEEIDAATKPEKNYLVSWKDKQGASHNGSFPAKSLKELREICQAALPGGTRITDIEVLSDDDEVESCTDVLADDDMDDTYEDIQEIDQEFTSKNTSINSTRLPAIFRLIKLEPGTVNLDYGGGKFDNVADYFTKYDVINLVYDPFNRSKEHNQDVLDALKEHGGADTATLSNVLNVIKEPEVRQNVLLNLSKLVKPDGVIYITVYEGNGSGEAKVTKAGYQLNQKTADYLEEVQQVFPNAISKGKLIIADNY